MTDRNRLDVQTVTENSVNVAFACGTPSIVRIDLRAEGHHVWRETTQQERVGRVCIQELRPDTSYDVEVRAGGSKVSLGPVRTLPAPVGPLRFSFAVVADPHLALTTETRRGRLFAESPVLLRETLRAACARSVDLVLIPGDLTEGGTEEQYALAQGILATAACPVWVVPGDHDVRSGIDRFEQAVGPARWARDVAGVRVIGCDSSRKSLDETGVQHMAASLPDPPRLTLMLSHLQFTPDAYIVDEDRVVADSQRFQDQVVPRLKYTTIAYAGHKNVPSQVCAGNLIQLNTPQPVQYPCGWLHVRVFDDGVYHTFQPIFSELLNECSCVANDALGVDKWQTTYRRGTSWTVWNNRIAIR